MQQHSTYQKKDEFLFSSRLTYSPLAAAAAAAEGAAAHTHISIDAVGFGVTVLQMHHIKLSQLIYSSHITGVRYTVDQPPKKKERRIEKKKIQQQRNKHNIHRHKQHTK